MEPLLFIAHRIPYPPNKGDKIRSYHLLRHLADRYDIYLASLVDNRDDFRYEDDLRAICADVRLVAMRRFSSQLRAVYGLFDGRPLTLPYFYDARIQRWVDRVAVEHSIKKAIAYSSSMAQYIEGAAYGDMLRIIDLVDVDSSKWEQYSQLKRRALRWLYRLEARRLLRYERRIADTFDACFFVSKEEAGHFKRLAPESASRVSYYNNGVDVAYFDPDRDYESPYNSREQVIVFTGAMDYWANVDAVTWFAETVFPAVLRQNSESRFYIVGANPSAEVRKLARMPGIVVTGTVPDVRPYLAHAAVAVAPLRVARGIQNKVLEAMAMARNVVATSSAAQGIVAHNGEDLMIEDGPGEMADRVLALLKGGEPPVNTSARRQVIEHCSWESNLAALDAQLGEAGELQGERPAGDPADSPARVLS